MAWLTFGVHSMAEKSELAAAALGAVPFSPEQIEESHAVQTGLLGNLRKRS